MKKFLFSILMIVIAMTSNTAHSQTAMTSATYGNALDTVTSTAAHYMVTGRITGVATTVSLVLKATEISGTTAGTATVEASLDGTNWYSYYDSKDSTYSFSLSDVTTAQYYRWLIYTSGDLYYRIKVVGISTPNVKIQAWYKSQKG